MPSSNPKPKRPLLLLPKPPPRATVPRILFVDDQPALSLALKHILGARADCVIVTSGLKAIRELESNGPFDLVVSDLKMPGLSGYDLLVVVAERWPVARRILLTGYTSAELLESTRRYADATLDKILDPEILIEKIHRLALQPRRRSNPGALK